MQILRYSAITIAPLIVGAVIYGQGVGRADKKPVHASPAGVPSRAIKKAANPTTAGVIRRKTPSRVVGAMSALGVSPQGKAEEDAAYAPSDAFKKQAQALYEAGDLSGAEAACFNALNFPPVIGGQPQHVPFVAHLLGQIYLKGGQYEKAIHWLGGARLNTTTVGDGLDLDLALAYVRMGDYKNASRFYSDGATLQYHFAGKDVLPQDLPGTSSPRALEASILLARGLNAYFEARHEDALTDFQSANRLVPDNALIAYHSAELLSEKGRYADAVPLFEIAKSGRGAIAEEASRHLAGTQAALRWPRR